MVATDRSPMPPARPVQRGTPWLRGTHPPVGRRAGSSRCSSCCRDSRCSRQEHRAPIPARSRIRSGSTRCCFSITPSAPSKPCSKKRQQPARPRSGSTSNSPASSPTPTHRPTGTASISTCHSHGATTSGCSRTSSQPPPTSPAAHRARRRIKPTCVHHSTPCYGARTQARSLPTPAA